MLTSVMALVSWPGSFLSSSSRLSVIPRGHPEPFEIAGFRVALAVPAKP